MITKWFSHLSGDQAERFKQQIMNSEPVLNRLGEILDEWEKELDSAETGKEQYSSPSWAAQQADRNGDRRRLRAVKTLINLDQRE